ncbi:lysozyme inhibitor LprI family protein [Yoonia sp. SDW83-1]|uniref:lysozyme inhibitor LprI family protein n=1 Tax=Yoonia sp. SDW83-1 TaxID=3366945 RepID=UPI00398C729E
MVAGQSLTAGALDAPSEFARDRLSVDAQALSDCVTKVGSGRLETFAENARNQCIGIGVDGCLRNQDASVDGIYDRPTYLGCIGLERRYWGWRMDRVIDGLSGASLSQDQRQFLNRTVPELDAMVAAWRAYVDIRCSYETSQYDTGPSRGREGDIVEWSCLNTQTARFALDLEFRLRAHCSSRLQPHYGPACEFGE